MLNVQALLASSDLAHTAVDEDDGLQQKLNLYQVFLRLYEQNRSLLDEILKLENSSLGNEFTRSAIINYAQGFTLNGQVGIVTNLMKGATQTIFQPQNIWTIGRDRRKTVIPIADTRLSRCHAAIAYHQGDEVFCLMDLSSTNGTFVNGEQIRHHHVLQDGDRVRLGSLSFTFFHCSSIREAGVVPGELVEQVSRHLGMEEDSQEIDHVDEALDICRTPPSDVKGKQSFLDNPASDDSQFDLPPEETHMFLRQLP